MQQASVACLISFMFFSSSDDLAIVLPHDCVKCITRSRSPGSVFKFSFSEGPNSLLFLYFVSKFVSSMRISSVRNVFLQKYRDD